jgi:hypothetical protein
MTMGRENIDSQTLRDKFLVNDFASKLQEMTSDGILTCAQLYKFARTNNIELQSMKPIIEVAGIRIKDCEQTCISLRCNYFK